MKVYDKEIYQKQESIKYTVIIHSLILNPKAIIILLK